MGQLAGFREIARKVRSALQLGGQFAVHYRDGLYRFVHGDYEIESVQQENPVKISLRFKEYLAQSGAIMETYTNESTGESCDYTGYRYSPMVIDLAAHGGFGLGRRINLDEPPYLDSFVRS